jgi:hypothetical protein
MKKTLILFFISINTTFAQSLTIIPNSGSNSEVLKITKLGIGLDHRVTGNLVGVGTYVNGSYGILQTHTNHPLGFATNNGAIQAYLGTNGNFGLGGITNPQYFLDVNGRSRIRHNVNTAGIWFSKTNNNVDEGSFFGNINDASAGIFIGNFWRFGVNDAGTVWIPNLAGSGTRPVGADASGNLVPMTANSSIAFSVGKLLGGTVFGNSENKIYFNNTDEQYDIGNNYFQPNDSYFYVPTTGIYHCTVNNYWAGNLTGVRRIVLRNQFTQLLKWVEDYPPNAQLFHQTASFDIQLSVGTEVYFYLQQDSGTNLGYGYLLDAPMFSCHKVN